MRKAKTSLSTAAVVGALVAAGFAAAPTANAVPKRHAFARTAPGWVAKTHSLGQAPAKGTSSFKVYLAPKGGTDALKGFVDKVSDPRSASYRHFLSAAQYHARFDPTGAAVSKISSFLRDKRLKVTSVEGHHRYIAATGSNAAAQQAFGVAIKKFRHHGRVVQANTTAVSVPADVASYVTTVSGLDTTPNLMKHNAPPPDGFRNARPCSRSYGQIAAKYTADYKTPLPKFQGKTLPYAVCGYTGPQYRSAYQGANPKSLTGKGVTVAVIDAYAAPTIAKDANRYGSDNGDGSYAPGQLSQVLPTKPYRFQTDCGPSGWYGEETLDVEAVHAMAPESNVRYYASRSCSDDDFVAAQAKVVDQNKASIVTNSYGEAEALDTADLIAAEQQVFLQGAAQGISFLFSSGDDGDELANTGLKQADASANDPYVTAVGGTSDAINGGGTFDFQTGWGTDKFSLSSNGKTWEPNGYLYGAGGGPSKLFNKPKYQEGVVPDSYGSGRAVPDVAMDGDPNTGMLVGETQTFSDGTYYDEYRIGGTSLASPLFAGMAALRTENAGQRLGFLNPKIYRQAGSPLYNDIKGTPSDSGNVRVDFVNGVDAKDGLTYSVRTFNQDSSLKVAPGWDNITGVGSPNSKWINGGK